MAEISPEHADAARSNGIQGGNAPGTKHRDKLTLQTPEEKQALIEQTATAILTGHSPAKFPTIRTAITEADAKHFTRFTGMTPDEFHARLGSKLRELADLTGDRIQEKLLADKFKPHELSFLYTVVIDKLQRVEGRAALQGANVNVQINNFGPQSKADILARLTGQTLDLPPSSPSPDPVPA